MSSAIKDVAARTNYDRVERENLLALERRIAFVSARLERTTERHTSWHRDRAERRALVWALGEIEAARGPWRDKAEAPAEESIG